MFDRNFYYRRRCVRAIIDVVEQVHGRWLARQPMQFDETTTGLLLLWSWLRWESDFITLCLIDLEVDINALASQVDDLLCERVISKDVYQTVRMSRNDPLVLNLMRNLTAAWVDRAVDEANYLHHDFVDVEHLLLALLRTSDSPFTKLFALHGIDYDRLKNAVLEAIEHRSDKDLPVDVEAFERFSPVAQPTFRPAVGLPRRFSMAVMMSWVMLFAMVFSLLKWLNTPPEIFGIVAVLMFAVGIA